MPRITAVVARPTTIGRPPPRAIREPIRAWPRTARSARLDDATRSVPRWDATTVPLKMEAPPAAGQRAAAAARTRTGTSRLMELTPLSRTGRTWEPVFRRESHRGEKLA